MLKEILGKSISSLCGTKGTLLSICCIIFPTLVYGIDLTVNLVGVNENTKQALTNNLTIYKATKEPKLSAIRIQNLHTLALKQLSDTLEALGFYHAIIDSNLTNKKEHWVATYHIKQGKPIIIDNTNFIFINEDSNNQKLIKKLNFSKLQKGNILNHADYEETKQNLLILLQENGYLSAKFIKSEININKALYKANIELAIDSGKQYVFGEIKFIDCLYSTELLTRFVPFRKGEPYTNKALALFRKNLTDSAMFRKIKISPKPNLANPNDNQVPIYVSLIHSPLNHYIGNVGYGTDTGIRGGLGWQHRISPSGHQLSNVLAISKIRKQAKINYLIPGKNPGSDRYIIGTGLQQDTIRDQYSKQKEISFTKIKKVKKMQSYWSLKCVHEHFRFAPNMPMAQTKFLLPGAKLIWTNPVKKKEEFTHGSKLELSLQGGLGMLLSSTDFIQTEIIGKWISPINAETRFIFLGDIGSTVIKNFNDLPLSLRFFAGGDRGIRGFAYHSLGPTQLDNAGNKITVGGKHLILTTVELERKLYGKLSAAIFVDSGNAMNTWNTRFASGAGFGLRWTTPIGAFKLDIAKQITQIQQQKLRLHLTFGTEL